MNADSLRTLGKRGRADSVSRPKKSGAAHSGSAKSSDALLIAKMKKQLSKDTERKGVDLKLNAALAAYGLNITHAASSLIDNDGMAVVNLVQQGTGFWNRIGRKISLQSLRIRGNLIWDYDLHSGTGANGEIPSNLVRMFVVWDKQPNNGPCPAFSEIFGRTNPNGGASTDLQDPIRFQDMERFQCIRDEVITLWPDVNGEFTTAGGTTFHNPNVYKVVDFDFFIDLKGRETVYATTANPPAAADITTGSLIIGFKAMRDGTTPFQLNEVSIGAASFVRLRYTDV